MGFPHPTVDVPGHWPAVADEVRGLVHQPLAAELSRGLQGQAVTHGHVCATAFVLTDDRSQLLLVRHARLGWSNPGGHVEQTETTYQAARRELAEETGLTDVRTISDGPVAVHVTDVGGDRPHRHWNVAWAFEVDADVDLVPEEGAPLAWFPVDALPTDGAPDLLDTWALVRAGLGVQ